MKLVSTNPDIRAVVAASLEQYPWLRLTTGQRHWRLVNVQTGDFIPIPFSPSDTRAVKNLRAQVRRLAQGHGLIAGRRSGQRMKNRRT